jgi:hypothetical protein
LGPAKILKNSVPKVPLVGVSGCASAGMAGTGYPVEAGIPGAEKLAGEVKAMVVRDANRVGMSLILSQGRSAPWLASRWDNPPPDRTRSHRKHGRSRSIGRTGAGKAWKLLTRELLRVQRVHPARRHRGKRTVSDREVSETRMRKGFKVSTVAEREFGREEV